MHDFSIIDAIIQQFRKGKSGIFISPATSANDYDNSGKISRFLQWKKNETMIGVGLTPAIALKGEMEGWNLHKTIHQNNSSVEHIALRSASLEEIAKVLPDFLEETYTS